MEDKKKKKKGKRRKLPGAVAVWPWRMTCGGEAGGWSWLQVAEQEERRRRKFAGERGTDGVCFAASEEFRRPLVMEIVTKRRWLEWWWPKATVEREGEEREKNCRNKGKWLVFVRL
jgi:hypothetical protein